MESKAKLAGHPIHPMLVIFPLGLLATSLVFDLIRVFSTNGNWSVASHYMIGAGVIGGLAAKSVGWWRGLGNIAVLGLFVASWILRRPTPADPPEQALVLSALAVVLAVITSWLAGEPVDRLSVGVDEVANLNATGGSGSRRVA